MGFLAAAATLVAGCSVSQKKTVKPSEAPAPLLTATKTELIERYNQQAQAINSLNATVTMKLTAGSAYSGVIEQYHEVNGFILAQRPSNIRVIGQAPVVGKNIFDMVSNGHTFHIFIPSKNKFITGPAALERPAKKPIESLRPQHLLDTLLWNPIAGGTAVLFEEANEVTARYYVLTILRLGGGGFATRSLSAGSFLDWEIAQKIWFDRTDLNVSRVEIYAPEGKVTSDVHYSSWDTVNGTPYARQITLARPGDDYKLEITVKKMSANESIAEERFALEQPPGTELVRVGEEGAKELQP